MTFAAVTIDEDAANAFDKRFRAETGLTSEMKGSRITMRQRQLFFDMFEAAGGRATVGIAISAVRPHPGEDRGDHDRHVYLALIEDVLGSLLPAAGGCIEVMVDDGRYDAAAIVRIRDDIGKLVGPMGLATMGLSHQHAGLQIADVMANSFFNRALVSDRQARIAAMIQPFLDSGQIAMRVLDQVD